MSIENRPVEREARLAVPADFELPGKLGFDRGDESQVTLTATYWDTADLRLLRWGHTLRYRAASDGSEAGWTLKLDGNRGRSPGVDRFELDLDEASDEPPRQAIDLLAAYLRRSPLRPAATIITERRAVSVADGDGLPRVELTDDRVRSRLGGEGAESGPEFRQLEVELLDGGRRADLDRVVKRLRRHGAGKPEATPKLTSVLRDQLGPPELDPPRLDGRASVHDLVAAAIADATARLVHNDPKIRMGGDPEAVHRARVATRRLRCNLRTVAPLLDEGHVRHLRGELAWIGHLLGRVRDIDVMTARLRTQLDELRAEADTNGEGPDIDELFTILADDGHVRRVVLLDVLSSPRYFQLLDDLYAAAANPPLSRGVSPNAPAATWAPRLARRPWRRLARSVRHLPADPSDGALHQVRKRAKQMRYAAELNAPLAGKQADRLAARLADLHDVLGELQDANVATSWLAENLTKLHTTSGAFIAGQLHRLQAENRTSARTTWQRCWQSARRKNLRAWVP